MENMLKYMIAALLLVIIVIALIISGLFGSPSTNAHKSSHKILFGVAGSGNMNKSEINAMNYIGVNVVRLDINVSQPEEQEVSKLASNGFTVLGILDYETLGVKIANGTCISNCNWTLEEWNASVESALRAYPEVHNWEIWNEPQIKEFQNGFSNGSPYNYYLMLKSAYKEIKAANSSDNVICLGGDMLYSTYYYQWAQSLWSYGAENYCDAISLHVYTAFTYLMSSEVPGSTLTFYNLTKEYLSAYENLTGKPIWITEVGIPSNNGVYAYLNNSLQKQSLFLNQSFSLFESEPFIKAVVWFNLEDSSKFNSFNFGLLNPNSTLKPSAYTYRSFSVKDTND